MQPAVTCGNCMFNVIRLNSVRPPKHDSLVCHSHLKQLSKLTNALERSSSLVAHPDQQQPVTEKLLQLSNKWEADSREDDESLKTNQDAQHSVGVRRLADALEIDFSVYDGEEYSNDEEDNTPAAHQGPNEIMYFDTAKIHIKAGDGGKGCCAFRREKFVSHGGPAGGNGGDGGSVWVIAEGSMNSLKPFRNKVHWKAKSGVNGSGKDMHGARAEDLYIPVPPGIIIRRADSIAEEGEPPLAELLCEGDKALIALGGRGGRGNASFKTSLNKAPVIAEDGELGASMWLDLELKLIADVGIIGMPSAGKSSLLAVLSDARPKVAAYHFTTLVPNLGVCEFDMTTTVFADVPGLIVDAHKGKGLGHTFLRHVSRARALVHVLDGTSSDPVGDFGAIRRELGLVGGGAALARKPYIVAYNKVDIPESGDYAKDVAEELQNGWGVSNERFVPVSAATGEGVIELVRKVRAMLAAMPPASMTMDTDAINQQAKDRSVVDTARIDEFEIDSELGDGRTWFVYGTAIERFVQMTNWDYFEAVLRFQRTLKACGLWRTLERKGVQEGDTVVIGDMEFRWAAEQREGQLYELWVKDLAARGKVTKGSARWPHMGG